MSAKIPVNLDNTYQTVKELYTVAERLGERNPVVKKYAGILHAAEKTMLSIQTGIPSPGVDVQSATVAVPSLGVRLSQFPGRAINNRTDTEDNGYEGPSMNQP